MMKGANYEALFMQFSSVSCYFFPYRSKYSPQPSVFIHPQLVLFP